MEDNKFWFSLWTVISLAVVAIIITALTACYHSEKHIVELVKAGANPIEARCAIGTVSRTLCEMHQIRIAATNCSK